ncbi:nucleotidyltransferase [Vibrio phage F99]|nr:hypothetical protein MYOV085v1_p0226 [Vibrio phage 355E48.1]
MYKIDKHIPTDIKDFLDELLGRTEGYDVYLGGGYLRDVYWNLLNVKGLHFAHGKWWGGSLCYTEAKNPKDLDIFFIPQVDAVSFELPVLPKTYINYDIMAEDIPNVRDNVKRVRGLFNSNLSTRDIQFIVYDKPMTMKMLAEDMDTSINQAMYCPMTQLSYCTNAFYNSHEDKTIEMLHEFEVERMYGRLKRMQSKFPDYKLVHNISEEEWLRLEIENIKPKKSGSISGGCGSFIDDGFDQAL